MVNTRDLSEFTANVGSSIDTVRVFDNYAVKELEGIAKREQIPRILLERAVTAISPLAAFEKPKRTEAEVKDILLRTAAKISTRVTSLIDESFTIIQNLMHIEKTLILIQQLTTEETKGFPRLNALADLWERLAHPDDYEQYQSHATLLTEMTDFYGNSSLVVEKTRAALNHVQAELKTFRKTYATAGLNFKDEPLDMIVSLLRESGRRLEPGNVRLQHFEQGGRPQIEAPKESPRMVPLNRK